MKAKTDPLGDHLKVEPPAMTDPELGLLGLSTELIIPLEENLTFTLLDFLWGSLRNSLLFDLGINSFRWSRG